MRGENHLSLSAPLLAWYDRHARVLPWRVPPGQGRQDPYRVWLSEIMLQQTTVAAVAAYYRRFLALWPTVEALAAADDADVMGEWAGLGYYARARNLLKCARVVAGSGFPDTHDGLIALPGVGPYTAAAIAAIAFDRPEAVVDGNVERVMARLHALDTPLPKLKDEVRALVAREVPDERPGDFAQSMMDLGATICTPRSPACGICPLSEGCKARGNAPETYPRRAAKVPKPERHGFVYVARRSDGALLTERRPPKGLLGGMLAFPTGPWGDEPTPAPPFDADWSRAGEVKHTFTHFHLTLVVMVAQADDAGAFSSLRPSDLPSLMRKVHDVARDWFQRH